jgi:hypothetical protein
MKANRFTKALVPCVVLSVLACGARSSLGVGAGGMVMAIVVPAGSGPPQGEHDTTAGATATEISLKPGDQLDFVSATGLPTYGPDGPPCSGMPATDWTGRARYLNGMPACPGKVDTGSVSGGYIGALLFGVACGGQGTVEWQEVYQSPFDEKLGTYQGCAGPLYLLYNDDPGEYSDNMGAYTVTIEDVAGP